MVVPIGTIFAQVECRPSSAPPISMHTLSAALDTRQFVAAMGLDELSEIKYRPINYNNSAAFILAELNRRASD